MTTYTNQAEWARAVKADAVNWFKSVNENSQQKKELKDFLQRWADQMLDTRTVPARSIGDLDLPLAVYRKICQLAPSLEPKEAKMPLFASLTDAGSATKSDPGSKPDPDATEVCLTAQLKAIKVLQTAHEWTGVDKNNRPLNKQQWAAMEGNKLCWPAGVEPLGSQKEVEKNAELTTEEKAELKNKNPMVMMRIMSDGHRYELSKAVKDGLAPIYHKRGPVWLYTIIQQSKPIHDFKSHDENILNLLQAYKVSLDSPGVRGTPLGKFYENREYRPDTVGTREWVKLEIGRMTLLHMRAFT